MDANEVEHPFSKTAESMTQLTPDEGATPPRRTRGTDPVEVTNAIAAAQAVAENCVPGRATSMEETAGLKQSRLLQPHRPHGAAWPSSYSHCSPRWNAPSASSVPPAPALPQPPRACASAGPSIVDADKLAYATQLRDHRTHHRGDAQASSRAGVDRTVRRPPAGTHVKGDPAGRHRPHPSAVRSPIGEVVAGGKSRNGRW
jgi:hypothetical protein